MKKITLSISAIVMLTLGVSLNANAQYWSLGVTGGLGVPTGDFGAKPTFDVTNSNIQGSADLGYGLGLRARYHFTENMAVGLNLGFLTFPGQPFTSPPSAPGVVVADNSGTFTVVPLMAAFDYYFMDETDAFRPFLGLEAGYLMTDAEWKETNGTHTLSADQAGFALAPVAGFLFNFSEHVGIIFDVKYMYGLTDHKFDINKYSANSSDVGLPATQYVGINLGVNFTFGN
jgi:outer membrane protein W